MILGMYLRYDAITRAPRIRGDDPLQTQVAQYKDVCSPHPRG